MTIQMKQVPISTPQHCKDFEGYVKSIHPRYDWRECLAVLKSIYVYRTTYGKDPSTSDLLTLSNMTRARLMGRIEAMEPQYVQILGSKVLVVVGISPYLDPGTQRRGFNRA